MGACVLAASEICPHLIQFKFENDFKIEDNFSLISSIISVFILSRWQNYWISLS